FKIVTDLERAADLAVNLGEYALASEAFIVMPKDELLELGEFACEMLEDSLKAFRNRDVERAREVIERDRQMDQRFWNLRTHVLTQLIKSSSACPTAEEAQLIAKNTITVLWSIRDLERVGDHAVNICARTIYWVSASAEYI
ncbi:MAG: phosphate uptake regulator PhoU, partial [Candidatus Bipolaricaulia bacterium]